MRCRSDCSKRRTGAARTITLPDGKTLQVTIPEGAEDRQMLRLKGQGMPGIGGGPAGDAYVELHVEPHPFFQRKDDNVHVEVPVTLKEAVLGARIEVPTIGGPVTVTVPKGSNTGSTLRLRDRGIRNRRSGQRGHQLINLKVVLPTADEPGAGRLPGKLAAESAAGPAQGDADMMRVDELVAAIPSLQRSDLEAWIRDELVAPAGGNAALRRDGMRAGPPDLHAALRARDRRGHAAGGVCRWSISSTTRGRRLLSLTAAVAAQDKEVQAAIIAAIGR